MLWSTLILANNIYNWKMLMLCLNFPPIFVCKHKSRNICNSWWSNHLTQRGLCKKFWWHPKIGLIFYQGRSLGCNPSVLILQDCYGWLIERCHVPARTTLLIKHWMTKIEMAQPWFNVKHDFNIMTKHRNHPSKTTWMAMRERSYCFFSYINLTFLEMQSIALLLKMNT